MNLKYLKLINFISVILYFFIFFPVFGLERPKFDFDKWFYVATPFYGTGYNSNQIPFRMFQFKENEIVVHSGSKSFGGYGNGTGLEFLAFNKNWQILYVGFKFPMYANKDDLNFYNSFQSIKTAVTGHVISLRYTFFESKISPFIGSSYFQGDGPHDHSIVNNFILYSYNTNKFIQIPRVDVKVYVQDPNPYIGLSFKLPIQNWKIDTIYSYGFERVFTHLNTSYGKDYDSVDVYNNFQQLFLNNYDFNSTILPMNYSINKKYFANRLALSLFMDYRRFVSLRLTFRRDLTFNRWVSNAVFGLIFSQHFGLSIFYEYSERSVGTIRYWLAGPSFVFQL